MRKKPEDSPGKRLALSDSLAVDRTMMANERTGLAFVRTGLNLVVVGLAMFRFFQKGEHDLYEITGILALLASVILSAIGIWNFLHNVRIYRKYHSDLESDLRPESPAEHMVGGRVR